MYYENELFFIQKILEKCHLQCLLIDPEIPIDQRVDMGLRDFFEKEKIDQSFFYFFPDIKAKTVYRVTDVFLFRYIFFELPQAANESIFLIGPYLNCDVSHHEILEQGEKLGISPKRFKELEMIYSSVPVIKEENHIFAVINSFAEFLWNGSDNFENVDISRENAAFISNINISSVVSSDEDVNFSAMEKRYEFENELINAVSQGNSHKAESMMMGFSLLSFENRTSDQLRNIKNYCIIMNTLLRKAAESGGVHPIYINRLSTEIAMRIENIHLVSIMPEFMLEILRSYCKLVRSHSFKNYSHLIQSVIITVESELTAELGLNEMAKQNCVSPAYLSSLFKKETGKTYTQFVNERRIGYAKHLLKTTNLQIQTIAQHCGIPELNYFCRVFKSITGRTPTQYRNGITVI